MIVLIAAIGTFVWWEGRVEEQDRHAILAHVNEMERAILTHDTWWHVQGADDPARDNEALEGEHQKMLKDFDRLSHIPGFRMTDVRVDVRGDEAVVEYGIEGTPDSGAQAKMPSGGELHFRRGPKGWEMTSHRLKE